MHKPTRHNVALGDGRIAGILHGLDYVEVTTRDLIIRWTPNKEDTVQERADRYQQAHHEITPVLEEEIQRWNFADTVRRALGVLLAQHRHLIGEPCNINDATIDASQEGSPAGVIAARSLTTILRTHGWAPHGMTLGELPAYLPDRFDRRPAVDLETGFTARIERVGRGDTDGSTWEWVGSDGRPLPATLRGWWWRTDSGPVLPFDPMALMNVNDWS